MTKVDERAFVPEIDDDARRKLGEALDREGVVAAMLIGSQARGEAGPLSEPLRDELRRGLKRRIREGRFGRSRKSL